MYIKAKLFSFCDFLIVLFFAVLAAAAGILLITAQKPSAEAEIYLNSDKICILSLDKSQKKEIETEHGTVVIAVENGYISVESSPCPDKVCINSGKKGHSGDSVACLPEKLLIILKSDSGVDLYV